MSWTSRSWAPSPGALNALDFPVQLLVQTAPAAPGTDLREQAGKRRSRSNLPPQTRGGRRVPWQRLLTDLEARDGILDRRFYAVCEFARESTSCGACWRGPGSPSTP